jgi:GAF domain-containing protein
MSAAPDRTLADLQQTIDDLQRQLAERTAERDEGLAREAAMAEVLGLINSSSGDLAPVFDGVLERAVSLSEAVYGHLWRFDGEHFHPWRSHGDPQFAAWFEHLGPVRPNPDSGFLGRVVRGERVLYIADVRDTEAYRTGFAPVTALADIGGGRSVITVALRKDDAVLGALTVYRQEVRPFSDKQIALLENFAAQAVIAMENARLITETREALEQQTATAEVLQVINSSPGDLAPVFDAILEKAHSLCRIAQGSLQLYDGERFRAVAVRGFTDTFADMLRRGYPAPDNPATRPLIEGSRFTHIRNLAQTDYSITRSAAELEAVGTLLCVPLRRDEVLLGMIASAPRGPAVLRERNRIARKFRRTGGHRNGECSAAGRITSTHRSGSGAEPRSRSSGRRASRGVRAGRPTEAVPRAATCRTHRLAGRREDP